MNTVCLSGRTTRDMEMKRTQSGKEKVSFRLAVNKDKEHTDFFQCFAYGKTAELAVQYVGKGSLIGVEGKLITFSVGDDQTVTAIQVNRIDFLNLKGGSEDEGEFPE